MNNLVDSVHFRKKLIIKFLCYFTVAILSVFLNIFGYITAVNTLEEEIYINSQHTVEKLGIVVDGYLSDIRGVAYSLLTSEIVKTIQVSSLSEYELENYTKLLASDIRAQSVNGTFSILIRNKDIYIQNNFGRSNLTIAHKSCFSEYDTKEAWLTDMYSQQGVRFYVTEDKTGKHIMRMVYYVPTLIEDVAIIADVDTAYVRKLISLDSEYTYILDENEVVLCSKTDHPDTLNAESVLMKNRINLDGSDYIATHVKSDIEELMYVKLTNYETYVNSVNKVKYRFILSFIVCLVLGAVISYFLSRFNLIKELKYMNQANTYKAHMENETLKRLITGKSSEGDAEYIESISKRLIYGCYSLVMFDFFEKANGDIKTFEKEYIISLCGFIEKKLSLTFDDINFETVYVDGNVVMIIAASEVSTAGLSECFESISAKLYEEFNVEMCCAISDSEHELFKLKSLYNHCLELLSLSLVEEKAGVLKYDKEQENRHEFLYPYHTEELLMKALKEGDCLRANEVINSILVSDRTKSLEVRKFLLSEIICTLIKASESIYNINAADIDAFYKELAEYYNTSHYFKLKDSISEYVKFLCDYAEDSYADETVSHKKSAKIREYIEDNYFDINLNVNILANQFNVSRSWLSTNFKKDYGVNISDFIVSCRINKAKELLATDMSVNDIAERVGFTNKTVYCRAFKRQENITSGQYREFLKNKSNQ